MAAKVFPTAFTEDTAPGALYQAPIDSGTSNLRGALGRWPGGPVVAALLTESIDLSQGTTATFTRAGSAVTPRPGAWSTAGTDARRTWPVLLAPGVSALADLIEGPATNLCWRSEAFDQWSASAIPVPTADSGVAPTNAVTAELAVRTASAGILQRPGTITLSGATRCTVGVWARAWSAGNRVGLRLRSTTTNKVDAIFNLSTGTLVASLTTGAFSGLRTQIIAGGNGWFWCEVSAITDAAAVVYHVGPVDSTATTGGWEGGAQTADVLLFGAMAREGEFATSPITTAGASAARATDDLTLSCAALAGGGLNRLSGTVLAIASPLLWADSFRTTAATLLRSTGTASDLRLRAIGGAVAWSRGAGTPAAHTAAGRFTPQALRHLVGTWDLADGLRLYDQGALVDSQAAPGGLYPAVSSLRVGADDAAGAESWDGLIHLRYWPRALNATEIALLAAAAGVR